MASAMQTLKRRVPQWRQTFQALVERERLGGTICRTPTRSLSDQPSPPSFGIAFDIDGVVLRGGKPIGGAPRALQQLYDNPSHPAQLRVPYIFLTNGGGVTEVARAAELSQLLGVPISPDQVLLGHTPFKTLVDRFGSKHVLAIGKGEPDVVLRTYGFQQVIHMDSYVHEFDNIDPLERFKPWIQPAKMVEATNHLPNHHVQVAAVFVVSDPVDWGRDLQVICDVLRSGGHPGRGGATSQTPIYFAANDLEYQSTFPIPRLGMGAFRIALEGIYNQLSLAPLVYTSFGKPKPTVYNHAVQVLQRIQESMLHTVNPLSRQLMHGFSFPPPSVTEKPNLTPLKTIYMIGDNPVTDIKGAKTAGGPWFAILTRTGCYQERSPLNRTGVADKVVEDVEEAIHFISEREGLHQCQ